MPSRVRMDWRRRRTDPCTCLTVRRARSGGLSTEAADEVGADCSTGGLAKAGCRLVRTGRASVDDPEVGRCGGRNAQKAEYRHARRRADVDVALDDRRRDEFVAVAERVPPIRGLRRV